MKTQTAKDQSLMTMTQRKDLTQRKSKIANRHQAVASTEMSSTKKSCTLTKKMKSMAVCKTSRKIAVQTRIRRRTKLIVPTKS
jgi:peptidyl-tRNA hydrolase